MRIGIHVKPNASKDEIIGRCQDGKFKIKVQSPPVDGAANKRLIKLIAKTVGVSKSRVRIVHGVNSRDKVIEIDEDKEIIIKKMEV